MVSSFHVLYTMFSRKLNPSSFFSRRPCVSLQLPFASSSYREVGENRLILSLHISSFPIFSLFLTRCFLSFTHLLYYFAFVFDDREHGNAYFITYRVHCSASGSSYFFASSFSTLDTPSTYHLYRQCRLLYEQLLRQEYDRLTCRKATTQSSSFDLISLYTLCLIFSFENTTLDFLQRFEFDEFSRDLSFPIFLKAAAADFFIFKRFSFYICSY